MTSESFRDTVAVVNFLDPRLPMRFWDKVQPCPMSGCWIFTGGEVGNTGYGKFWLNNRTARAHRVSFVALKGPIPLDRIIDHKCRQRCCVNPAHLDLVTHYENQHRSPLTPASKTHCPSGHPYSGANLKMYRGERICVACEANKQRKYREKKRNVKV